MIKYLRVVLLVLAVVALTAAVFAQNQPQAGERRGPGMGRGPGMMMDPEMRLQRMSETLNLTDAQKAKIKPILQDEAKQMQALRDDTSMAPQDKFPKMRELREKSATQIRAVLTPEQQKKHDEMQQQMRGPRGQGRPPAPPQQ